METLITSHSILEKNNNITYHQVHNTEMLRTYSSAFNEVGDHNDDIGILVPDHLPKVIKGYVLRTLGCDERSRPAETLQKRKQKKVKRYDPEGKLP